MVAAVKEQLSGDPNLAIADLLKLCELPILRSIMRYQFCGSRATKNRILHCCFGMRIDADLFSAKRHMYINVRLVAKMAIYAFSSTARAGWTVVLFDKIPHVSYEISFMKCPAARERRKTLEFATVKRWTKTTPGAYRNA